MKQAATRRSSPIASFIVRRGEKRRTSLPVAACLSVGGPYRLYDVAKRGFGHGTQFRDPIAFERVAASGVPSAGFAALE